MTKFYLQFSYQTQGGQKVTFENLYKYDKTKPVNISMLLFYESMGMY